MGDLSWRFDQREYQYLREVLGTGFTSSTSGSMNSRLEEAFARRFGTKYAISFNSGTTTLHAALWAMGVGHGDEVILPPLTVISCMNVILQCNAVPVFADVNPDTFLLDPKSVIEKITPKTKVIMPVHLYGQVCDMTQLVEIAREHDLQILEDSAQCYLGTHEGKLGGTIGEVGSWSFENSKHLTTGDGGIVACNDEELATKIRKLGCQGMKNATAVSGRIRADKSLFQNPKFKRHDRIGFMYRLPEVAAALGLAQLEKIEWFVGLREKMARYYQESISGCEWIIPQKTTEGDRNSYFTFAARFDRGDLSWEDFRNRYIRNGGDGIYAAWSLLYQEDSLADVREYLEPLGLNDQLVTAPGTCPVAESIQPQLMQFTTNQKDESEMQRQTEALYKTIRYYS